MLVLGIESSCDETAAAVIEDGVRIRSTVIFSQHDYHRKFGGVVPEIASRAHVEKIDLVIDDALQRAGVAATDLDCIAVTNRPGLVGSLLVGLTAAKMLALSWNLPLVGVDHVQAHLYASRMHEPSLQFPALGLIVSGGHTALYAWRDELDFDCLGQTIDDAAGEAFDKVASILQLPYPGGPEIDRIAKTGNALACRFPKSFAKDAAVKFSFSGLKTAVLYEAMGAPGPRDDGLLKTLLSPERKADLAASFQKAVVDILILKTLQAARSIDAETIVLGGGVACNSVLRSQLEEEGAAQGIRVVIPPVRLCTDNAAMIAGLGSLLFARGECADLATLDAAARV